jgi:hypothetical protein
MHQRECNKQLFIYINNFLESYFLCKNQGVTLPLYHIASPQSSVAVAKVAIIPGLLALRITSSVTSSRRPSRVDRCRLDACPPSHLRVIAAAPFSGRVESDATIKIAPSVASSCAVYPVAKPLSLVEAAAHPSFKPPVFFRCRILDDLRVCLPAPLLHHLPLTDEASPCLAHAPLITVWSGFAPPQPHPLAESGLMALSIAAAPREPPLSVPRRQSRTQYHLCEAVVCRPSLVQGTVHTTEAPASWPSSHRPGY